MSDIKHITFSGNIGQIDKAQTNEGTPILKLRVASSYPPKGDDERKPEWINCAVFGNRAKGLAPHLKVGDGVMITGNFEVRRWKSEEHGNQAGLEVTVGEIKWFPKAAREGGGDGGGKSSGGGSGKSSGWGDDSGGKSSGKSSGGGGGGDEWGGGGGKRAEGGRKKKDEDDDIPFLTSRPNWLGL